MSQAFAFKILLAPDYETLKSEGQFWGTPADLKAGFIHLSTKNQLSKTISKHYSNVEDALILTVDMELVTNVRWEAASDGLLYPHIYGPITSSAVVDVCPIAK